MLEWLYLQCTACFRQVGVPADVLVMYETDDGGARVEFDCPACGLLVESPCDLPARRRLDELGVVTVAAPTGRPRDPEQVSRMVGWLASPQFDDDLQRLLAVYDIR